ncbi:MAG: DUF5320 domain-containing protein [Candidatus Electryonea clarkiae]|nr:DUF5320 domain-containing protein [Candidatus Electryonea clarkiae]MDP8285254.1 DUF5320 domain-containing protein [Candidatus Electryonea clarkiae]
MPLGDGTGPEGKGPSTGFGLGGCFQKNRQTNRFTTGTGTGSNILTTIILPLGAAVVTDLLRPNSALRRIAGGVVSRIEERKRKLLPKP